MKKILNIAITGILLISQLTYADSNKTSTFAYIGTYNPHGEGVYLAKVENETGVLKVLKLVSELPNAAQLAINKQGDTLYVASEVKNYQGTTHGSIVAYKINSENGDLSFLNQVDSQGAGPVYLSLTPTETHLLVANYISGSIASFMIEKNGELAAASSVHQSSGPAGAAKPIAAVDGSFAISDHDGPHAHMIAPDPSGRFIFSTDLGLDRIYQWRFDEADGKLIANDQPFIAASSAGAGPRHFVFHPNGKIIFLINEESSTLTSYLLNTDNGRLSEIESHSTLPKNYKGTSFASGLVLNKDGSFLYVANRLRNSIAQFRVNENGGLQLIDEVWTGGDYPRTLEISPSGQHLYALNQRSDNIIHFQIDPISGTLKQSEHYLPVGSPSQMIFIP